MTYQHEDVDSAQCRCGAIELKTDLINGDCALCLDEILSELYAEEEAKL